MSHHAREEAALDRISLEDMEDAYIDPDFTRPSAHDELREIRGRWFGQTAIEVVVDTIDRRVVTVWRKPRVK